MAFIFGNQPKIVNNLLSLVQAELTNNVKDLSDNAAHTEEVKGKLVTALADLANERRKVTAAHSNMIRVVKDIEDMQTKLQDSKKLKVAALNLCNKVRKS